MVKERKTPPSKTRALLQKEIGSQCPFCRSDDVGHFVVHHLDGDPKRNAFENLLMVCPTCHSKITKGDISPTEVLGVKTTLLKVGQLTQKASATAGNTFCGQVTQSVIGNHNRVTYNVRPVQRSKYPDGCIGSDTVKANYVSYLITRYHECKEWEVGKENMRYALFPARLKKLFHVGKQRTIYHLPLGRFEELTACIQDRIAGTALAKINAAKGQVRHFQAFDEYVKENG